MWELIWMDRFSKKIINNDPEITKSDYPDKVRILKTSLNISDITQREIRDFEDSVIEIIDEIIDEWLDNYLKLKWKRTWDDIYIDLDKWNLRRQTTHVWDEMFMKAKTIEETIKLMWDDDDIWIDFDAEYILSSIEIQLNNYRNRIFWEIMKIEKKLKNNKQIWK